MKPSSLYSISKIKEDLKNNFLESTIDYLSKITDKKDFTIFKEHKILLFNHSKEMLLEAYLGAIKRVILNPQELNKELYYIHFIDIYSKIIPSLNENIKGLLEPFLNLSLREFLFLVDIYLKEYMAEILSHFSSILKKSEIKETNIEEISNLNEHGHQELVGLSNDMFFAITNIVNEFLKLQSQNSISIEYKHINYEEYKDNLQQAIYFCSNINCLQNILDRVSYGEWEIIELENTNSKFLFTFSLTDILLEKARDLGLKRRNVQKAFGDKESWLREKFESFALTAFESVWNYFQGLNETIIIDNQKEYFLAKKNILNLLDELNPEDEILIGLNMDKIEVISPYLSAYLLCIYVSVADTLKSKSTKYLDNFTFPIIPEKKISQFLKKTKILGKNAIDASHLFISSMPLEGHMDLFKAPFIKSKSGEVISLDLLSKGNWQDWVRTNLMQGGSVANQIGKSWEGYIVSILRKNNWQKVISGIKIKKDGKFLTDIDIIAKRDNLLLVIQLKVYYGNGINQYEQWKFRKKLIYAVQQVKIAEKAIAENINVLRNWFDKKELKEITVVKPLIMTNSHIFNGWIYEDVNVMSTGSLMQIINGASVIFTTPEGKIMGKKKYINSDTITVKEFLEFIEKPLDWRIGCQNYSIKYLTEKIGNLTFKIPRLQNEDTIDFLNTLK